ncbi:MAG: type II toxin-antitoxin system YafQ family toxin [Adlercreutzia sp.]|uniref:type II toxin-antitoxin system YafQ family toxin n=1 Tax=uncultured Adlercreutzia sp. TaxID=875803 RepID=UPI00216B924C|nr:type II toxin-antitoxin system YafQ family toxin [uncultured Adlercreutzia sp.]MCI8424882.1 type II toxin-antitoxin system YafQ family toxin [Adlercreutzia sp.]
MLEIVTTSKFRKDARRMKKRGADMGELKRVIDTLAAQEQLSERHRDHALTGPYVGFRECHIKPDWLLVYAIDNDQLILTASRTGTHSDLFDE